MTEISASLLGFDLSEVKKILLTLETCDRLHLDIMDGHFVPNISMGFPLVESILDLTELPIDLHLMVTNPLKTIERMPMQDIDSVTAHVEAIEDVDEFIQLTETYEFTTGIAVNPSTQIDAIEHSLEDIDRITVMGVEPGFSGQEFQPEVVGKIESLDKMFTGDIEVDGGVTVNVANQCVNAGVDIVVSGSTISNSDNRVRMISMLRNASEEKSNPAYNI